MRQEEADVRTASTGQLEGLVQAYERVLGWAPEYVADRLERTSVAAQNTRATARIVAVEASRSGLDRDRLRAERAQAQAEELDARRALLEEIHAARQEWAQHTAPAQAKANEAALELTRREKAQAKVKVKAQAPPDTGQPEPPQQPEPRQPSHTDEELADLARLARERIAAEREAEEAERDPWDREDWEDQYEQELTATWQPGKYVPEADPGIGAEAER